MHLSHFLTRLTTILPVLLLVLAMSVFAGQAVSAAPADNPVRVAQNPDQAEQPQEQEVVEPDIQSAACQGAELKFKQGPLSGNECQFNNGNGAPEEKLNQLVASIVNLFSVVVGVVSVIMIIYGGFRYIISGGDSSNVTNAKNTILYAIIGLVIVAFAQFIVKFVLAKAVGVGA